MLSITKGLRRFCNSIVLAFLVVSCTSEERLFVIQGQAQGSTYAVKYIAKKEIVTKSSIDSLLLAFDMSLSTYRHDSKISKINAGDSSIIVDAFLKETFQVSNRIFKETNGLFDPTIGVLVNAYGFGPDKSLKLNSTEEIVALLPFVGFDNVRLNADNSISKKYAQTYFDFNAIAQGYSVDIVADFLKNKGIKDGLVEIGGEIIGFGSNKLDKKPWIIGIDDPTQTPGERSLIAKISLRDLGMATSGNYRKVITDSITGQKFVHIINPKTANAEKSRILSATVLSNKCIDADGYATAFMIMPLEDTQQFLNKHPELYVLLIYTDENNSVQKFMSKNFSSITIE